MLRLRVAGGPVDVWRRAAGFGPAQRTAPTYEFASIRRTWPNPGIVGPKPWFETQSAPSGPIVIPVGNVSPETMVVFAPDGSIRTMSPVPGVGAPAWFEVSSTYMRWRLSKASPRTVVRPVAQGFSCPLGVSLQTVCVPGATGTMPRLPTKKLPL